MDIDRASRDHGGEAGWDRELEGKGVCACWDEMWFFGAVVGQDVQWVIEQAASIIVSV